MTEYKRTVAAVDKIEELLTIAESEAAAPPERKAAHAEHLALRDEWLPTLLKIKKRADEPDPEKRTYGEAMVAKVIALWERYHAAVERGDAAAAAVAAAWAPFAAEQEAAERQREAERAAELERLKRLAAEEEARAEAAKAEQKRQQDEAEQRRAEEYREQVRRATEERLQLQREKEEEERERGRLERYLNSTPSRELLRRGLLELKRHCMALPPPADSARPAGVAPGKVPWGLRVLDDTIRALHQFMKNLAGHPDSQPLKHVRCANENFAREIGSRGEGAFTVLYSVGYRPAGFGELKFLVLEEIDCVGDYSAWERWWEEVKWTRDRLGEIAEALRRHRRGAAPDADFDLTPLLPEPHAGCTFGSLAEVPLVMQGTDTAYYS